MERKKKQYLIGKRKNWRIKKEVKTSGKKNRAKLSYSLL